MQRIGRVVKVDDRGVMVSIERMAACRGCGACGRDVKPEVLFARGMADVGDVVRLELESRRSTKPFPLTYPLYTLGLLAGVIIANRLWEGSELGMVFGGAAGLTLSVLALKLQSLRLRSSTAHEASVVSVNDLEAIREINGEGVCPKAAAWSSPEADGRTRKTSYQ